MGESCLNNVVDWASQVYITLHESTFSLFFKFTILCESFLNKCKKKKICSYYRKKTFLGLSLSGHSSWLKIQMHSDFIASVNNIFRLMLLRRSMPFPHFWCRPNTWQGQTLRRRFESRQATDFLTSLWFLALRWRDFGRTHTGTQRMNIFSASDSPVLGTTSLPPAWPNTAVALWRGLLGVKETCGVKRFLPLRPSVVPTAL